MNVPLAERVRPESLADFISQTHLVGESGVLTAQIQSGQIPSLIFWGPPGTGKTTLAQIIAKESERPFYTLSAISSGVKDVRTVIEKAKDSSGLFTNKGPILFIDEIHRFSKSQQDSLLGAVEKGWVTLIGATTENPSFEVIPALLSRCQVYVLKHLEKEELVELVDRALAKDDLLQKKKIEVKEYDALLMFSGGDARKLLNVLELVANLQQGEETLVVTNDMVENTQNALDKLAANRLAGLSLLPVISLTDDEISDLVEFLKTLTDPCTMDRACLAPWIPDSTDTDPDGLRLNAVDNTGSPL